MNDETVATLQPLSEWHLETLSKNAAQLYAAIWQRMTSRSTTVLCLSNDEASRRARVTLQNLPTAQSELVSAGLLMIDPGTHSTKYEFVADPDNAQNEAGQ